MGTTISRACRSPFASVRAHKFRLWNSAALLTIIATIAAIVMLLPARTVQAQTSICQVSAASACISGHMYLYNVDGSVTDVTASYVQTGTVYDAQKGYLVQTGRVTNAAGSILDVTVDWSKDDVGDWSGKKIGFIAPQSGQLSSQGM